jgi:hypothetical protein
VSAATSHHQHTNCCSFQPALSTCLATHGQRCIHVRLLLLLLLLLLRKNLRDRRQGALSGAVLRCFHAHSSHLLQPRPGTRGLRIPHLLLLQVLANHPSKADERAQLPCMAAWQAGRST